MPKISNNHSNGQLLDRTYIGIVKDVVDKKAAGRIRVWIPDLDSREDDEQSWITCNYCSPFGGATSWRKNSTNYFDRFDKTQTAYGMWMIPPDVDNDVVVLFPAGDVGNAIWIGSVFKEYMNHSIPDAAYSDNNKQFFDEKLKIPVTEYNKWDTTGDAQRPVTPVRPYHKVRFEGIGNQGLIADEIRGITTSSSMRESPSQVFGINTPGPKSPDTEGARQGGHSFIMDDGDENGNDSYIGFKTKSGASIRIDETNDLIYAINKSGTSWMQMDADGNVDIFGAGSISMRTEADFNVRADGDINLEAGKNVNIKAAQNTDASGKVAADGSGEGGNIHLEALNDMYTTVDDNMLTTVTKGNVDYEVQNGSSKEYIKGNVDIKYDGNKQETISGFTATKASQYDLDSGGNMEIAGTFHAGGTISSSGDVVSSLQSLNALFNHGHMAGGLKVDNDSKTPILASTSTATFGQGGSPTSASGPNAERAATAPLIAKTSVRNMLIGFDGTMSMNLNNDSVKAVNSTSTIEVPDYWNRQFSDIESIVKRLMTYEPCPAHINKGNQE